MARNSIVDRHIASLEDQYCTVKEAIEILGISYMTLYRRIDEGRIRRFKIGPHRIVLSREDVLEMKNFYSMTPVPVPVPVKE